MNNVAEQQTTAPMTYERWQSMNERQKAAIRKPAVPACLAPYKGMRIEATDKYGDTRRFWVGQSTGWAPCFLEVKTTRSMGGDSCSGDYSNIRVIKYSRG